MTSFQVAQWLRQGIAAAKAGDIERAYDLLLRVVDVDEYNEQAWLWLSSVVETDADREVCLENILAINPENKLAKTGLVHLRSKTTLPAVPAEPESSSPSEPELEPAPQLGQARPGEAQTDWWDQTQAIQPAAKPLVTPEKASATAPPPVVVPREPEIEREKPAPQLRRRRFRPAVPALAIPVLFLLGLLAASVAAMGVLRLGLFDPTRRDYASAMRPLLDEYAAWWEGPQGALINELNSLCGPDADGWRKRDVLVACSTYPATDCGLLAAHCEADVDAMRKQIGALSREVQQTGGVLLTAVDAISPPDDIALAHTRFRACLEAELADASRVNSLTRGEALANPNHAPACQMFLSAEAEVQAYVAGQ